jgi:hypothetical protein
MTKTDPRVTRGGPRMTGETRMMREARRAEWMG